MMNRPAATWRYSVLIGTLVGAVVGGAIMYIAWQHNPQEEFRGAGGINWFAWLAIGVSWFVPVVALVGAAIGALWSTVARIGGPSTDRPNRAAAGDGRQGGIR